MHNLYHRLCLFSKVLSNGDAKVATDLLDCVSDSIRDETRLREETASLDNKISKNASKFISTCLTNSTNSS